MVRRIVVVGASAGGVEALITFAGGLPQDLDVPVAVVLHVAPTATSVLPAILSRAGPLDARHAHDGEKLEPGRIYIAPPNQHLLVEDSTLRLARGPHENGHRPAIDPLFRSAASDFLRRRPLASRRRHGAPLPLSRRSRLRRREPARGRVGDRRGGALDGAPRARGAKGPRPARRDAPSRRRPR